MDCYWAHDRLLQLVRENKTQALVETLDLVVADSVKVHDPANECLLAFLLKLTVE
jgi:hypothetical protein